MRWFDGLQEGSIGSYEELNSAFGAKFVTCSKIPRPFDSAFHGNKGWRDLKNLL